MNKIEEIVNLKGIRGKCCWKPSEGLFMLHGESEELISNFIPLVTEVIELDGEKVIFLTLHYASGVEITEVQIGIKKLRHIEWFEISSQCIFYTTSKEAASLIKQIVRIQVAEYEDKVTKTTYYKQLGWNKDVFGNPVYVFGDSFVGGDSNAVISPTLKGFKFQFLPNEQDRMLHQFVELLKDSSTESSMTIGYFFSGLIKLLYKEAGVPVNFILYINGEQQNRKTTLAKLTNNLYCRAEEMDFCVRTVEKMTPAVMEKEISLFKDTTYILDDVSLTSNLEYQRKQESIVEKVARLIGNNVRKTSNVGVEIREYLPNANVIVTGEYIPRLPESTLSRMLIVELWAPCDGEWLTKLEGEPLLLSTVAYSFIAWVQENYDNVVECIQDNFNGYRESRIDCKDGQERLYEHGFVIQCTFYLLSKFLEERGKMDTDLTCSFNLISDQIREVLEEQIRIMKKYYFNTDERDYCKVLVLLYSNDELDIAKNKSQYDKEDDDGFFGGKNCICISTTRLCAIMRFFYQDNTITINSIIKQLKNNRFLDMDKSKKSTKKVNNSRYLHIRREMLEEYQLFYM